MAFKEWFTVCEALGHGVQDLIIRKGGIHEGKGGFEFIHDEFYLFPTLFHKQAEQIQEPARQWMPGTEKKVWDLGETVLIKYRCSVERCELISDWQQVLELVGRHVYAEELLRDRFDWEGKGMDAGCINVAYVRTEVLEKPIELSYSKAHGGCRSWLEI
ncbi:DUF1802 family protein [Rubritalea spongiae]|uniref:DUF1802 family protein n=1 Tax=Rubritalea spongiae TaxID=430797 RepID=A0ABW5E404_9BACT